MNQNLFHALLLAIWSIMVRTHSHEIVADKYGNYNEEMIDKAIQDREKGPSLRKAAEEHGVPL